MFDLDAIKIVLSRLERGWMVSTSLVKEASDQLKLAEEKFNSAAQSGPANKPSMPVCHHARLKWSVYDCTINSFALDLMDCNGEGTYSVPGNSGVGYSHQCKKFRAAHFLQ